MTTHASAFTAVPSGPHTGVVLVAGARTPVTGRSRAQAHLRADELAAVVLAGLAERTGVSPSAVVLGNCTGPGGNLGRIAALGAGFGSDTVGWTVDAQCGSGMLAVQHGAEHVARTGQAVAAGGTESPSTAPQRVLDGIPYDRAPFAPEGFADPDMTAAAEDLAQVSGIGRARQDALAVRSHRLARDAVRLRAREVTAALRQVPDDGPRALSASVAARFAPVLGAAVARGGSGDTSGVHSAEHSGEAAPSLTVTPATAARIADGAAAVMLVPADGYGVNRTESGPAESSPVGLDPAEDSPAPCLLRASVLTGGDPALPGIAPVTAVRTALGQAGVELEDVAAVEIVEAYAAQVLAVLDELDLAGPDRSTRGRAGYPEDRADRSGADHGDEVDPRVNAAGGALALGHPWGASGALAVLRLMHRLDAMPPGSLGVAACAIAGGMGAAVVLQRLPRPGEGTRSDTGGSGEPGGSGGLGAAREWSA